MPPVHAYRPSGLKLASLSWRPAPDAVDATANIGPILRIRARPHIDSAVDNDLHMRHRPPSPGSIEQPRLSTGWSAAWFGRVCAAHVIYYWANPLEVLLEIKRVLKPGGTLAVTYRPAESAPAIARRGMRMNGARLYERAEVPELLELAGLVSLQERTRMT